jgi:NitT/TauT family transport system substrate-binding protein
MSKAFALLLLIMALVAGSFGCDSSKDKKPIKIGISVWAGVEPAELAARKGFYKQRGVDVEMVRFSAYTDSIAAFREGKVDIDMQTLDDAIRLSAAGRDMRVVVFTDYSYGGDGIVARQGINSIAELKGKTVGVEVGTVGHFSLLKALEKAGLDEKDITIVSIPAWEIKEGFLAGKIDAGVTWEPYLTATATEGKGKVIITSRDYPETIVTTMAVNKDLIDKRREDVQKIVTAYFDALAFVDQHPDEAYSIMAEAEGVTKDEFKSHVQGIRYIDLEHNKKAFGGAAEGKLYAGGRDLADFLHKRGVIKAKPDIGKLLDGSFAGPVK